MTSTPAETNLLAWHTVACRYASCLQPIGRRCITTSGDRTSPHAVRLADLAAYLDGAASRNTEVAALVAQVATLTAQTTDLGRRVTEAADDLAATQADLATAQTRNKLLEATHLLDLKTIAELKAQLEPGPEPTPDPTPTPQRTLFGACVLDKGAAGVVAKYGQGAAIRQFQTTPAPVTVPAGSLMHLSAKPAASITDAQIDAWLKAMAGHIVTFNHEPDNDGLDAAGITAMIAKMNRLYDRNVALGRPCLVAPTFTGGLFASYSSDAKRDVWMTTVKGDLLGIDCDGIHDDATSKPADLVYRKGGKVITYADEIANGQRYIKKYAANGWQGITVPEFGISRASWDTDGAGRAQWIRSESKGFVAAGVYAVMAYDFQDTKTKISDVLAPGSLELAAFRTFVS